MMTDNVNLSDEINEQIDALTDRIARKQGLSEDVAHELHSHIEDKVLAYLSGDEAVGEADAMLLATNHFGDARQIKALLGETHRADSGRVFGRRLFAVAIASFLAFYVPKSVNFAMVPVFRWADIQRYEAFVFFWSALYLAGTVAGVLLAWRLLTHWRSHESGDGGAWYQRLHTRWLMLLVTGLYCGVPFADFYYNRTMRALVPGLADGLDGHPDRPYAIGMWVILACMALTASVLIFLWPWWCDREPRSNRVVYKSCAWAASWLAGIFIVSTPLQPAFWWPMVPYILGSAVLGLLVYVVYRIGRVFQPHAVRVES